MNQVVPLDRREQDLLRKTIGLRCRKARGKLDMSQRTMAKAMGRSPSWVREIESGAQYAPAYLLRALASATCVSVAWFYGEQDLAERIVAEVLQLLHRPRSSPPELHAALDTTTPTDQPHPQGNALAGAQGAQEGNDR